MINQKTECPNDLELADFLAGLANQKSKALEKHIEYCSICQQRLDAMTSSHAEESMSQRQKQLWVKALNSDITDSQIGARLFEKPFLGSSRNSTQLSGSTIQNDARRPVVLPNIPGYRILNQIGSGGMGAVYRAHHLKLGRDVAIKVLRPTVDPKATERFEWEMKAVGQLSHPHIVQAFDAGESENIPFIVMELLDGQDLGQWVDRNNKRKEKEDSVDLDSHPGGIPSKSTKAAIEEVCDNIAQAARGLQAAHDAGLVHRDVKPSNLFATSDGAVKLLDLGLATSLLPDELGDDACTQVTITGSPDYMSPEQATGSGEIDARSDIYGLGCTLFALLAGRPPFVGLDYETMSQKLLGHATHNRPNVQGFNPAVPSKLADIVSQMMSIDPSSRPQTAAETERMLQPFCKNQVKRSTSSSGKWIAVVLGLILLPAAIYFSSIAFAYDSNQNANQLSQANDERLANTEPATPDPYPHRVCTLNGLSLPVSGFCFGTTNNDAFSVSLNGDIVQWNVSTGESSLLHQFESGRVGRACSVTADGQFLFFGNSNGLTKLNLENGEPEWSISGSGNCWCSELDSETILHGQLRSITFRRNSDGSVIFKLRNSSDNLPSISRDKTKLAFSERRGGVSMIIKIKNLDDPETDDPELVMVLEEGPDIHTDLQFSRDETMLIGLGLKHTSIWDAETGERLKRYRTRNERPQHFLVPIPNTDLFLTLRGQLKNKLVVWDPVKNELHRTLDVPPTYRFVVSKDGKYVMTSDFLSDPSFDSVSERHIAGGDIHVWKLVD